MTAPVPVGTGGPETPLNYIVWGIVCGVVAVLVLGFALVNRQWWALALVGISGFAAVGSGVKAVQLSRRRRER